MTIKMKAIPALNDVIGSIANQKLSFKTSYKLMKLIKEVETEFEYYRENVMKILEEYGERDSNGNLIQDDGGVKLQKDKIDLASKKIQELDEVEVQINSPLLTLDEMEDIEISLRELAVLDLIIKKED